ncbi:MAG TPA: YetF domain-containing protein [Nostocaceae cyanobacterium]|nr:YetF domain-containing protein [Nostocaceae cyanobacterium]
MLGFVPQPNLLAFVLEVAGFCLTFIGSTDELMSKLRQQGVKFLHEVKFAYIETDGSISIITVESDNSVSSSALTIQNPESRINTALTPNMSILDLGLRVLDCLTENLKLC